MGSIFGSRGLGSGFLILSFSGLSVERGCLSFSVIFVTSLPFFFFGDFVFAGSLLFGLRRATGFGGGVSSRDGSGEGDERVDGGGDSDDVSDVAAGEDMILLSLVVDGSLGVRYGTLRVPQVGLTRRDSGNQKSDWIRIMKRLMLSSPRMHLTTRQVDLSPFSGPIVVVDGATSTTGATATTLGQVMAISSMLPIAGSGGGELHYILRKSQRARLDY
jgi:hypothetical protein